MTMKKKILTTLSVVLILGLAALGILAYLSDTDSDVNVMTLGNVQIEQIEQERDANGDLKDFQGNEDGDTLKPLYPLTPGYDSNLGEDGLWHNANNAVDKLVSVKNTGKSEAYVRTWFAFEMGTMTEVEWKAKVKLNINTDKWTWTNGAVEEIEGEYYYVMYAVYNGPLASQATTEFSLKQVALVSEATNDDVAAFGDEYVIKVFSQAVQTAGFKVATGATYCADLDTVSQMTEVKALDAAFGIDHPWKVKTWDGTVDKTWYNDTDTEFEITTAEQLAGLAELVDGGNTFAGKTIKLGKDLDLAGLPFNPIGHSSNGKSFNGTFDGQGHTISNMYQQSNLDSNNGGWIYEGQYYGLFAYTNGATIKNVSVADAYISSGRNEAAAVVGNAVDTTFSDITVSNTTLIAYNNSAGGVAAECYGNCSFTNITVDEDTVIGPLWGTYDVRLGGVVGMVQAGNNVTFKDITVACKLDAINDVAANYQYWLYRYSGMLIGHVDGVNGVADPTGYVTCENVKVIYGDWVNYHYCEFKSLGAGSYNGPCEYKYARVEAGTGTDGIDLSTCNHNADESHNVLIVFDQLFGGGQGVSGLKTYDGVTVVYPN